MSLEKGQKLGPYEIQASAGAGGMGEVYKATDTRLGRTVAIKVLPPQSALNADSRARFEREARTISSLNHPNICTLHDIGHENGVDFLVMELLEGESLADRLSHGKLDTVKVLEIASQIAGALEAAHRKGVVHRDLKPGNIFLTKEGAKLLDFGLAKLQAEAVTGLNDETRTTPVTGAGAIVGTLQYMSPEQLEAKEADTRSDIFSLGAVLYEMVIGQRAFTGTSRASLIGSIMKDEPRSITEIQPTSPPALDRLIRKCLAKDPDDRWQSAKDLKDELDWVASSGSQGGISIPVVSKRRARMRLSWIVTALALCAVVMMGIYLINQKHDQPKSVRFTIPQIPGTVSMEWPTFSPDGSMIAFVGYRLVGGTANLGARPAATEPYVLPGTEGVFHHFWSPDSKYLAFFANAQLKRVAPTGGLVQVICDSYGEDGTWNEDGLILFDARGSGISGVSASGGTPREYTVLDSARGEVSHGWPCFMPDGVHFLFMALDSSQWVAFSKANWKLTLKIGSITSPLSEPLLETESRVEYCYPGYLLYIRGNTLVAHPFDTKDLKLAGDPLPLASGLTGVFEDGGGSAASNNGHLAFIKNGLRGGKQQGYLTRVNRKGNPIDTIGELAIYGDPTYSPDNRKVAYSSYREPWQSFDITIYDLSTGAEASITKDQRNDALPVWSPDGSTIAYSAQSIFYHVYFQNLSNIGDTSRLSFPDTLTAAAVQWTPDDYILLQEAVTTDIMKLPRAWLCPAAHPDSSQSLLVGPQRRVACGLSPDSRYLLEVAYVGSYREVYVVDLNDNKSRRRVSDPDGDYARWRSDGREIYYLCGSDLMAVSVDYVPRFALGKPKRLFPLEVRPRWKDESASYTYFGYDATSDGQEFVIIKAATHETTPAACEVILNWSAELEGSK